MAWLVAPPPRSALSAPYRRVPRACAARENELVPDHAISVAPTPLESFPYPGESLSLSLATEQLRLLAPASLLNRPPRALLYLPPIEGAGARSGALLAVSSAKPDGLYTATVEATAVARARVERNIDDIALVARVHDWILWEYSARIKLAKAMRVATCLAEETRKIRRQLGASGAAEDDKIWAKVHATRADDYDTDLKEDEWERTPNFVRETWCKRAEFFSFAAIRYSGELDMSYAKKAEIWDATNTLQRVNMACELLVAAKAEATAKLSLKHALDESASYRKKDESIHSNPPQAHQRYLGAICRLPGWSRQSTKTSTTTAL